LQARGSLADTSFQSLLESAQTERATGTLTVRATGSQTATTLYFLFGHLFHATGEAGDGDDAVVAALLWPDGEFDFDGKAKLPADETVRSSIPELIERAARTQGPSQPRPAVTPPRMSPPPRPATPERHPRVQPPPVANGWTPPAPATGKTEVRSRPPSRNGGGGQGKKYQSAPRRNHEPIPVPQGQVVYDSLKSSFVDFPRLLTTLEREGYTGYVRLVTENTNGLIFFRDGQALESVFDRGGSEVEQGTTALLSFQQEVTTGNGELDVVSLSSELVDGLYQMTTAEPMYTDLYASWVDSRALVEFLSNRGLNGTVTVRARDGVGVMILAEGDLAGAYTSQSREISDRADAVLALCDDPEAMIEVKTARGIPHERLDVNQVLGLRMGPSEPTGPLAPQRQPAPPPSIQAAPPRPQPVAVPMQQAAPPAVNPYPTMHAPPPNQVSVDWDAIVADLQQATDEALGNRSRKVKDILVSSDRSPAGIEAAIDQIPQISILFVDTARLESLANELRARLYSHLQ
jgi:hypothetical protein